MQGEETGEALAPGPRPPGEREHELAVDLSDDLGGPLEIQDLSEEFTALTLDVWKFKPESAKKVEHPVPFLVELPRSASNWAHKRGDVVLDPFMGSGSTAIAAIKAG